MSDHNNPLYVIDLHHKKDFARKPTELIHVQGHQSLSLHARRTITLLWHNAHEQGIKRNKDYTIELSDLTGSNHKGYELIESAIEALMTTLLVVKNQDGDTTRVQFLGGNNMASPDRPSGTLTYSFDKRLIEILEDSRIWGEIYMPVLIALSSKYAISLYEHISEMVNLKYKEHHTYELNEFREILGIPSGTYKAFGAFKQSVLVPTISEISALANFNLTAIPVKTGRKVTHIKLFWYMKSLEEVKAAWQEINQPKIGRKERISGHVDHVIDPIPSEKRR